MRARISWLALAILVLGGAGPALAQSAMHWQTNLDAAKRLAAETNRLVLLHFWSESCPPCMRMEREVFARPDVAAAIEANFVPAQVNAHHFPMTAREFGVNAVPTDLILTPQGGLIYRKTGGSDAAHYVAILNQVAAAARNPGNPTYASANPNYPSAASAPVGPGGTAPPGAAPAQWPTYPPQANPSGVPAGAAASPPAYGPGPSERPAPPAWSQTAGPQAPVDAGAYRGPASGDGRPPAGPGYYQGFPAGRQPEPAPQTQPAPQAEARPWQPEAAQWNGGGYPAAGGYGQPPEPAGAGPRGPAEQYPPSVAGVPNAGYGRPATDPNVQAPGVPPQSGPAANLYQAVATPAVNPAPLALDGFCPVSLIEKWQWVKGDPRYGVIHRGRTYLFAGPEDASRFYADPDRYVPVMSGMDVVLAVEEHRQVPGRREHGALYDHRVFLFSSEATFRRFDQDPTRYAAAAMQATTSMARRLPGSLTPPSQWPSNPGYQPPVRY